MAYNIYSTISWIKLKVSFINKRNVLRDHLLYTRYRYIHNRLRLTHGKPLSQILARITISSFWSKSVIGEALCRSWSSQTTVTLLRQLAIFSLVWLSGFFPIIIDSNLIDQGLEKFVLMTLCDVGNFPVKRPLKASLQYINCENVSYHCI